MASTFPRRSLYLASFLLASGGGMVFSLLGRLQDTYGFSTAGLGYLTAATFVASPIASIGLSPLADRGHSRQLIIASIALGTLGALWFAFGDKLWQLVCARSMIGFAFGLYQPTVRGLVVRHARATGGGAGEPLAKLSGIDAAGFTLGPGVGAVILHFFGLRAPFLVVAALLPFAAVGLVRRLPKAVDTDAIPSQRLALDLLRSARVRVALLLAIGNFLPVGVYDSLWARYLEDRGASTLFVGLSLSLYGIPYMLAAAPGGRLVDRLGPLRALKLALAGVVPLVVVYGLVRSPWVIAFMALLEATFGAVAQPAAQAAMAAACPTERLAAGQGLAGAGASFAAAGTALVAAPLYARVGSVGVFSSAAAAIAVVMVLAFALAHRLRWTGALPTPATTTFDVDHKVAGSNS